MSAKARRAYQKVLSMAGAGIVALPFFGQTVTIPNLPTTPVKIPAGTTFCTVPKNGGPCKNPKDITLPAVTIIGQKLTVSLSGFKASYSCKSGTATKNADGTTTISGVDCTVTP